MSGSVWETSNSNRKFAYRKNTNDEAANGSDPRPERVGRSRPKNGMAEKNGREGVRCEIWSYQTNRAAAGARKGSLLGYPAGHEYSPNDNRVHARETTKEIATIVRVILKRGEMNESTPMETLSKRRPQTVLPRRRRHLGFASCQLAALANDLPDQIGVGHHGNRAAHTASGEPNFLRSSTSFSRM